MSVEATSSTGSGESLTHSHPGKVLYQLVDAFNSIEVKQPGNKPTEIQKALIRKFQELGVTAGVVTSIDEVVKIIEELK